MFKRSITSGAAARIVGGPDALATLVLKLGKQNDGEVTTLRNGVKLMRGRKGTVFLYRLEGPDTLKDPQSSVNEILGEIADGTGGPLHETKRT
jgi:hypothetical protein